MADPLNSCTMYSEGTVVVASVRIKVLNPDPKANNRRLRMRVEVVAHYPSRKAPRVSMPMLIWAMRVLTR